MFSDFYHAFYYSGLIIAAIISSVYFKKLEPPFRWLAFLILLTLVSELTAKYVAFNLHQSNSIVYHFFTPIEYLIYVMIFKLFFQKKNWNRLLWVSVAGLTTLEVMNSIFFQRLWETNTNTMIIESVLLIFLSLILFNRIRETASHKNLLAEGIFWFNSAVLFYYSFNILIWGFHNLKVYLLNSPPKIIYDFNLVISGLLYITYTISITLNYVSQSKTSQKA